MMDWYVVLQRGVDGLGLDFSRKDCKTLIEFLKSKDSEIAEISRFDKAVSGYMMWLDAKIRENTLIEPEEARDELRERLKGGDE